MTVYPDGRPENGLTSYDGGYSAYPQYLHNLMKAEAVKEEAAPAEEKTETTGETAWKEKS